MAKLLYFITQLSVFAFRGGFRLALLTLLLQFVLRHSLLLKAQ